MTWTVGYSLRLVTYSKTLTEAGETAQQLHLLLTQKTRVHFLAPTCQFIAI